MAPELDHLSYSSISSYLMCAANWKFHYLDKIKTPTSPALVFGSAFHNTVEKFISSEVKSNQLMEIIWLEKWVEETTYMDENEQLIPRQDIDWGGDTPEYHCNEGLRLLTNSEILDGILSIQPLADDAGPMVERKVELQVPGVPIPIIGYIDIITEDFTPADFKTSSTSWSIEKANAELQPLYYLAAMNQMGMATKDWKFIHYIFVKTKTPKFQMLEHYHNPNQLIWLFKIIKNVWDAIEKGVFPENPLTWKCNPKWCEFYMQCRGKYE